MMECGGLKRPGGKGVLVGGEEEEARRRWIWSCRLWWVKVARGTATAVERVVEAIADSDDSQCLIARWDGW
jgi:hypothetical protein